MVAIHNAKFTLNLALLINVAAITSERGVVIFVSQVQHFIY
jgi:hypothetical protein